MALSTFQVGELASTLQGDLLVVMPIYNEEATIGHVIEEWTAALRAAGVAFTFVMINDGSRDGTWAKLREIESALPGQVLAIDKLNSGHGLSCRLGYDIAAASRVEWMLQIDSDGQCDPSYFPEFWRRRENADCVFGLRKSRGDGAARKATSWVCSTISSLFTGTSLTDANVPYRLIRTSILREALTCVPRNFNVQNVGLSVTLQRTAGVRWAYVPIHFRDRQGGTNSIDLVQVAKLGLEMLVQTIHLKKPRPRPEA